MMSASAVFFIRQLSDCTLCLSGHVGSCLLTAGLKVMRQSRTYNSVSPVLSIPAYTSQSALHSPSTTQHYTRQAWLPNKQNLPADSMRHS